MWGVNIRVDGGQDNLSCHSSSTKHLDFEGRSLTGSEVCQGLVSKLWGFTFLYLPSPRVTYTYHHT